MREQQKGKHARMHANHLPCRFVRPLISRIQLEALEGRTCLVQQEGGREGVWGMVVRRLCCSAVLLLMMLDVPP